MDLRKVQITHRVQQTVGRTARRSHYLVFFFVKIGYSYVSYPKQRYREE